MAWLGRSVWRTAWLAAVLLFPLGAGADAGVMTAERQKATTPQQALERLLEGNARFLRGEVTERDLLAQVRATAGGQHPFASIVTCIDSRIPAERLFDLGVGDAFVARIAGNFVDEEILGSLEFASAVAGSKVILVLGHTDCGAIKGACDGVELGNLTDTLAQLRAAVEAVPEGAFDPRSSKNGAFVAAVTEANVRLTVDEIRRESEVLRGLEQEGKLLVRGAIYDVSTGRVTLLD
jgi:carbonic anhydrase